MNTSSTFLGGLSIDQFLREYWQKKPLLIRQAFPGFAGLLNPKELIALACDEDVQARIVKQRKGEWELHHSPFTPAEIAKLGKGVWTVLVQGVNHYLPEAADLLKHFKFVPHARLDDLMVSYAPKGGGVGPHFDSYDVFLLQGYGHRRWQISTQEDQSLIEGAPLRILQNFQIEQEWVLAPGDMLYLPPHCAHNGIAEDDCMTYSIGFRTPAYQELGEQFLVYLQDRICIDGMYADPGLKAQSHPSEIGDDMLDQVEGAIRQIRWDREDVANFLGCYLSEPKPHIFFDAPEEPLPPAKFKRAAQTHGLELDLKTQMLCQGHSIFINGTSQTLNETDYATLRELADARTLATGPQLTDGAWEFLYEAYVDGYLTPLSPKPGKRHG
ncbi:MAG: cupin domain-containing protein [Pseudomonadota bacterium]